MSDRAARCCRRGIVFVALVVTGLAVPVAASATPPGATAAVLTIETPVVAFAGGTAELDGSTTLEHTRTGTKSRIDCTILFAKDSDHLRPGARGKLRRLAGQLHRQGPGRVSITGYTDDLGSAAHGLDLSRRRARRVAAELRHTLPAPTFPMTVRGRGEADPAVPNTSEINRRKNRRVTVTLTLAVPTPARASAAHVVPSAPHPAPTATLTATLTPEQSAEPTLTQTSPAAPTTPAASVPPPNPVHQTWPLAAGLGVLLVLFGAVADLTRRRRATPAGGGDASSAAPDPAGSTGPGGADVADAAARPTTVTTPSSVGTGPGTVQPAKGTRMVTPAWDVADRACAGPGQPPTVTAPPPAGTVGRTASQLDDDIRAWFAAETHRPRLTLLGPVYARTRGQALARRKAFYTELLAYLTLRRHGATADEIADTFTLTTARVRTDMKVLRDWLGADPTTGQPYLPDARTTPAALQRGIPTYQVRNVLCDWQLFTRLQTRAASITAGERGNDLDTALSLVTGRPFDHTRTNGWGWIFEGDRTDLHAATAVLSVAHAAADQHRAHGDPAAAQRALAVVATTRGD